jgi:hypothetical protein
MPEGLKAYLAGMFYGLIAGVLLSSAAWAMLAG